MEGRQELEVVDTVNEPREGHGFDVAHVVLEFGLTVTSLLVDDIVRTPAH